MHNWWDFLKEPGKKGEQKGPELIGTEQSKEKVA